jgi:class 3 adenylate cyclase
MIALAANELEANAGMVATEDTAPNTLLEWAGDKRTTLAIVFTDIVGSTALGNRLGDSKMTDVRHAHFAQSDALLEKHGGRQIKTIGDSVLAVFRSTGAALDYARALHSEPGHPELQADGVRAGIHVGEVEVTADDIFGGEVAYAARVAHEIAGAEIWTSNQVRITLHRQRAPHHEYLRWQNHQCELKGFVGPQLLWSLAPPDAMRPEPVPSPALAERSGEANLAAVDQAAAAAAGEPPAPVVRRRLSWPIGALAAAALAGGIAVAGYYYSAEDATPENPPQVAIEGPERVCTIQMRTESRSQPDLKAGRGPDLMIGERVQVVGQVKGSDWLTGKDRDGGRFYFAKSACAGL